MHAENVHQENQLTQEKLSYNLSIKSLYVQNICIYSSKNTFKKLRLFFI